MERNRGNRHRGACYGVCKIHYFFPKCSGLRFWDESPFQWCILPGSRRNARWNPQKINSAVSTKRIKLQSPYFLGVSGIISIFRVSSPKNMWMIRIFWNQFQDEKHWKSGDFPIFPEEFSLDCHVSAWQAADARNTGGMGDGWREGTDDLWDAADIDDHSQVIDDYWWLYLL